ncbi:MAG: hypothetical protein Q9220_005114 [cf. Caloplaca sp. 1 TL-2023]
MPCLEHCSGILRGSSRQFISGTVLSAHSLLINLVPRPLTPGRRFEPVRHAYNGRVNRTYTDQDDQIIPFELPTNLDLSSEPTSLRAPRNNLGRPYGEAQSITKIKIPPAAAASDNEQLSKARDPLKASVDLPLKLPANAPTTPSASPSRIRNPNSIHGKSRVLSREKTRHAQDVSNQIKNTMIKQRKPRVGKASAPSSLSRPRVISQRSPARKREEWQIQKSALSSKFGSAGWAPRKRLSPDALEGIRALHAQFPAKYPTAVLANQFEVSAEAIRRILKSKWRPSEDETSDRQQRWDKRGERIWTRMVALGVKPPKKWRDVSFTAPLLFPFPVSRLISHFLSPSDH